MSIDEYEWEPLSPKNVMRVARRFRELHRSLEPWVVTTVSVTTAGISVKFDHRNGPSRTIYYTWGTLLAKSKKREA